MINQGALKVLIQALDFQESSGCIQTSLESLEQLFKLFQENKTQYQKVLNQFEMQGGIDLLEKCQYHENVRIYIMSVKVIKKHFFDQGDDPLINLINEV